MKVMRLEERLKSALEDPLVDPVDLNDIIDRGRQFLDRIGYLPERCCVTISSDDMSLAGMLKEVLERELRNHAARERYRAGSSLTVELIEGDARGSFRVVMNERCKRTQRSRDISTAHHGARKMENTSFGELVSGEERIQIVAGINPGGIHVRIVDGHVMVMPVNGIRVNRIKLDKVKEIRNGDAIMCPGGKELVYQSVDDMPARNISGEADEPFGFDFA